ncbi:MAG: dihydropteroate synthase [Bacteroidales bacterium]|nr:dihydropteroate synthase [Bacteroidales bacterium]
MKKANLSTDNSRRPKNKVMGIVNINNESFYGKSRRITVEDVEKAYLQMIEDGADIIDLGACSTRPGSTPVSEQQEWEYLEKPLTRIASLISESRSGYITFDNQAEPAKSRDLREERRAEKLDWNEGIVKPDCHLPQISIDTFRSGIVRKAYEVLGPFIVNDISAGEDDPDMLSTVAELGLTYIAMHKRGTPDTMQTLTDYPDGVVAEVKRYFEAFAEKADRFGIKDWILDPGFGFAKTVEQNYELLEHLDELSNMATGNKACSTDSQPAAINQRHTQVLVGLSRKSMIYKPLGITPEESLPATCVLNYRALQKGASILRVHDVKEAVQTVTLYQRLLRTAAPQLTL